MDDSARPDLRVRSVEPSDWRDLHELWSQPEVVWGTLQMPYQSAAAVRKKVEEPSEGLVRLVAEVEGKVVGSAGLRSVSTPRRRHVGQVGMMVHPDHWNRGVGSALLAALIDLADNWLDLTRLELTVYADNAAAIHLYRKHGFVVEGTHQAYALRAGAYVDTRFMARVRLTPSAPESA